MIYRQLRPLLFRLDGETAHELALKALKALPQPKAEATPELACKVAGLFYPNPVGLAAGFDKNAVAADAMLARGFGFVEIGTVTPQPQTGNPRPRLFRLVEDAAVINRMGFNNEGAAAVFARLAGRRRPHEVVGVNIGANKDSADRIADYALMARMMAPVADYLTINVSSPNTPGLRDLQEGEALSDLLQAVTEARSQGSAAPPLFLKVAPDLSAQQVDAIAKAALDHRLDGLIVSNTTIVRPKLKSRHRGEAGGLSGAPLRAPALELLRSFRAATGGAIPLVGAGGIASADDAWARIRAGASLVQLYSALVYEGPGVARAITRGLAARMRAEGFSSIEQAVGTQ
jgi:dihydroorotate dehydrogenase